MRGEFIGVWSDTWREIWSELAAIEAAPDDLFCELFREIATILAAAPSIEQLAEVVGDPIRGFEAFRALRGQDLLGERKVVAFLENMSEVFEDLGGDALANHYFCLLAGFTEKFSLRYDLRRPCVLSPTLSGIFSSLVRDLRTATSHDPHLDALMKDFDSAIRDLRIDCADNRIRTCIQRQVNLLEAMGSQYPGVTQNTIGRICDQVGTWPHAKIRDAMKSLYHFTCDYPGIRHGGTAANALRIIDMRDMVAMSILLAGFVPYLTDQLDANVVYQRG